MDECVTHILNYVQKRLQQFLDGDIRANHPYWENEIEVGKPWTAKWL